MAEAPFLLREKVIDLVSEGYGVLKPPNMPVVFVPFVIEGEEVEVRLTQRRRQLWYGEAVHWHVKAPQRTQPACADFGRCGGCRWQMMTYAHQLHHKRRFVEQALRTIGRLSIEVPAVVPSPSPWHYRNKAEYAFGMETSGEIVLGFHPRGAFDQVIGLQACQIVPPVFEAIRQSVLRRARMGKWPAYDARTHKGLLRGLLLRGTSEAVVALLILAEDRPDVAEALLKPLLTEVPSLTGIGYMANPKRNDSLHDLTPKRLEGRLEVAFQVGGRTYWVGPKAFFQVNLSQAAQLLDWLRARWRAQRPPLYDLYGGVGFFGIGLADLSARVVLVERLPEAAENAIYNFRYNQAAFPDTPWEVHVGSVETILPQIGLAEAAVALVDPPREGLHPNLIRFLRAAPFAEIFYVSCHPATQARDLQALTDSYEVVEVQPFDLFPHTTAVENIAWLRRKKA
ncbi:MAG: 23S rRNA (uracil(1939)-C(5))-methyltransferase RlmD [Bacteroidia bacterium]|nr:23S rRNA (uracil(1939)-C(5))-methyltransferase RlmD [Bacteroidia bacterium]MDW8088930.1 23S rRNA (uracil(1939)-C(5))-methyltransferase RlmD [Bacteroidia bacterium]